MKATLKPYGQRVIIRRVSSDKTAGGIYIPDTAKDRTTIGEIVAAGKDCVWTKPGDNVWFSIHSGFDVPVEGYEGCRCMNEEDLLGAAEVQEA